MTTILTADNEIIDLDEVSFDEDTLATTFEPLACADCLAHDATTTPLQCNAWHEFRTHLARLALIRQERHAAHLRMRRTVRRMAVLERRRLMARRAELAWADDADADPNGFSCPVCHLSGCGIGHQDVCGG